MLKRRHNAPPIEVAPAHMIAARQQLGLTAAALADALHVNVKTVYRMESEGAAWIEALAVAALIAGQTPGE